MSEYTDDELELIKRRKMLEYQKMMEAAKAEEEQRQLRLQRESILRAVLTSKARQRLANLKLVRPELVESIENQLIQLAQSGRIQLPITDEFLKEILRRIVASSRRDIKLRMFK